MLSKERDKVLSGLQTFWETVRSSFVHKNGLFYRGFVLTGQKVGQETVKQLLVPAHSRVLRDRGT